MIAGFQGEYRWLSNFWPAIIRVEDITFPTVEHAYVAAKSLEPFAQPDLAWYLRLRSAAVKKIGRGLTCKPDWDDIKLDVMLDLTRKKYGEANPDLGKRLLGTGDEYIEETNHWGDTFWGVCDGVGHNWLGLIIQDVRKEIQNVT